MIRLNGSTLQAAGSSGADGDAEALSVAVLAEAGYDALMLEVAESRRAISFPATTSLELEEDFPVSINQDHFCTADVSSSAAGAEAAEGENGRLHAGMAVAAAAAVAAANGKSPAASHGGAPPGGLTQPGSGGVVAQHRLGQLANGAVSASLGTGALEMGSRLGSLAAISVTDSCGMAFPDFNAMQRAPVVPVVAVPLFAECGTQTEEHLTSASGYSAADEAEESRRIGRWGGSASVFLSSRVLGTSMVLRGVHRVFLKVLREEFQIKRRFSSTLLFLTRTFASEDFRKKTFCPLSSD